MTDTKKTKADRLQRTITHLANLMTADLEAMRDLHSVGASSLKYEERVVLVRAIDAILARRESARLLLADGQLEA